MDIETAPHPHDTDAAMLTFDARTVTSLLLHSICAERRRSSYVQRWDPKYRYDGEAFDSEAEGRPPLPQEVDSTKIPPGLHLASRGGLVYLTSNGIPIQRTGIWRMKAAFAKGYGPDTPGSGELPTALASMEHARHVPATVFVSDRPPLIEAETVTLKVCGGRAQTICRAVGAGK